MGAYVTIQLEGLKRSYIMKSLIARDAAYEHGGSIGSVSHGTVATTIIEASQNRRPVVQPASIPGDINNPTVLWKLAQVLGRVLTTCLFDLKVFGLNNVPREGGILLVANHQSYLDPLLIGVRLSRPLNYVGKSELFSNRFAARFLRFLNAFPLRQGEGDIGAIKQTIARLREGRLLALFPEGERTPNGQMLPLQGGVGLVVRRAKVPVVPVAIDGSFDVWPLFRSMFRRGRIHLIYGPPMDLSNLRSDEIVRQIERTLREMFDNLKEMDARESGRK